MAEVADFSPRRFSTDEFPDRERLERWREEFGRTLVKVDIEPVSEETTFRADATLQRLPGLGVMLCAGSAARLNRTRLHAAADDGTSVGLIVNMGTRARATQRSADVVLERAQGLFVRTEEAGMLEGAEHLGLVFPRSAFSMRFNNFDDLYMRPLEKSNEALRLLLDYLRLLRTECTFENPALQHTVTTHIYDLAALALASTCETRENAIGAVSAARLAQLLAYLDKHFTDPELTVASAARHHGISERYLQKLLEQSGMSFTTRLNDLRLHRAFALLTDRSRRRVRVSEIALSAGFSDISHFNRVFRARYGDTPTGVRPK